MPAKSNTALPINTILAGRYQIERVIGEGGFGITYYARHLQLGNYVAIKEFFLSIYCKRRKNGKITFQEITSEKFEKYRKRFQDEARTLCKLSNPHVVHVHDIFDENDTTYIVMDYIAGETLQQKVEREGALPYDEAVNYMAQLCEAVEHIHANHILHRDIKPENIIITPQNKVVLIDFGSARGFVHDKEQKHTAMLTMGYAPIEQYTATSKKGNYTDLYAVGGTFYFILTGQKPIPAADRMLNDEFQPPRNINPSIPESASLTIMKALNLKPEERYQTVTEFQNDLLGNTGSMPQTAQSPLPTSIPTQQSEQSKIPAWVWILIGIIVVTGITLTSITKPFFLDKRTQNLNVQVDTVEVDEETQPEPAPQPSLITQGMVYDVVVAYYEDYDDYNQKLSDIRSQGYPGAFLVSFEQSVGGARVIALRTRSKSEAERTQQTLKRLGEKAWLWHHDCDDLSNAPELGHKRGRIHDKDGWCNVRAGQSQNADVIGILYEGEEILFNRTNTNWYEVYDVDSEEFLGYVHKTRIRQ